MKKLSILFVLSLMVTFFDVTKEEKRVFAVQSKELKEVIKKEYYVSTVPYINHDDYFEIKKSRVTNIQNNIEELRIDTILKTNDCAENKEVVLEENDIFAEVNESLNKEKNQESLISEIISKEENENIIIGESISDEEKNSLIDQNSDEVLTESENSELKTIDADNNVIEVKNGYYSPSGKYLGDTKVKVIDVSEHQGIIDWDKFVEESDCYGVVLRIGYYETLDKQFQRNINEIKRLNIPYGIYLFSYSSTINGAVKESNFTNKVINEYNLNPTLGIYYDIESWSTKYSNSNNINKSMYDEIVTTYINNIKSNIGDLYQIGVYSGRWYAMNRLGNIAKSYVNWVAEYNNTCLYDGDYKMWQYTSKGNVPGINGNVDISYLY